MSIYNNSYSHHLDISRGLQDILRKNGMQAHLSMTPQGEYQLVVLGHDSPALNYKINERQAQNLMAWGTNSENKRAYETFTSIVRKDFSIPDNYVSAKNAFGSVAMGLHGYRVGVRAMNRPPMLFYQPFNKRTIGWGGDFVGWSPRHQLGWHMRRINDRPFMVGTTMVPERADRSLRPGELKAGGYGFYYKGKQSETSQEVLDDLTISLKPLESAPRPKGEGIPYSEAITSDIYFSSEKFQEILASHGIVIDPEKKTLTIQSAATHVDVQYDLTDDEVRQLTANNVSGKDGVSVEKRLEIINNAIAADFETKIDREMIETKELVHIELKPDVKEELEAPFLQRERLITEQEQKALEQQKRRKEELRIQQDPHAINGKDIAFLLKGQGWFTPAEHGRGLVIDEIRVDKTAGDHFLMSAVINGQTVTHGISEKDYNKFLALDDAHRLKLFDKIFNEVQIKSTGHYAVLDDMYDVHVRHVGNTPETDVEHATLQSVNGEKLQQLNEAKGFYREGRHGREVNVENIEVCQLNNGMYKMTAVIDGQAISHEITQKDFDKFLAVDDYQRMKLFSKIFDEVDMKTRPGMGTNIGAAILAAMVVTGEVLTGAMPMRNHPRPELYETRMGGCYSKPGVINPAEVAAAAYSHGEQQLNRPTLNEGRGMGV